MARHNMFLLVNHVTEKFAYLNEKPLTSDEDIVKDDHLLAKIFDPDKSVYETERMKVYKYLTSRHYLPCIRVFHEGQGDVTDTNPIVDYEGLHAFLRSAFNLLNAWRNAFTHYLAIDDNGNRLQERSLVIEQDMKGCLERLFARAPDFSFKRFEATHEEKDFDHLSFYRLFSEDNDLQLSEQGFYFFINLFLERGYAMKFLKKFRGFKNETTPSFRATLQAFTAYTPRVPDVRLDTEDSRQTLLLEMLNELNRCPGEIYKRLKEEDKQKLVPHKGRAEEASHVLATTDYRDISDEDIDGLLSDISPLYRGGDRFPYFAARYIDEFDLLPNIRFQITLGKLQVDAYEKNIAGEIIERRVVRTVHAYGKLSDFTNRQNEVLEILQQQSVAGEGSYFQQYAPHYNMENNQLSFYLFNEEDQDKVKYPSQLPGNTSGNAPTGFLSLNDLPKLALLGMDKNKLIAEQVIRDFININRGLILNFEALEKLRARLSLVPKEFTRRVVNEKSIKGRDGMPDYLNKKKEARLLQSLRLSREELCRLESDELKRRIRNSKQLEYANQIRYVHFLENRKKELQEHLPEGLRVDQLPEQVVRHLLNINDHSSEKIIHHKIKAIYDDCRIRLRRIETQELKPEEERNLKLGELATFLSRDIIDMVVDQEVKQKITSPYYNKLQTKISYFSVSREEIIALCNELQLFQRESGHVFLSREMIMQSRGIVDFYKHYLTDKLEWIKNTLLSDNPRGGRYTLPEKAILPLSFFKIREKAGSGDFRQWLERKKQMPVSLPHSLFDKELEDRLSWRLHKENISFNEGDKFTIRLEKMLEGDMQPFYNFPRIYEVNGEPAEIDGSSLDGKTLKSRYGNSVEQSEKEIRFIRTRDRILRLFCEHILETYSNDKNTPFHTFQLSSIYPSSETSPLNRPFSFKQPIIRKGNEAYITVIARDTEQQLKEVSEYSLLTTDEEKDAFTGQKGHEWTIKDFGRFKRLSADRRIPSLSDYFEFKEVPFKLLEYQLKEYDKYREEIFDITFEIERHACDVALEDITRLELNKRQADGSKNFNNVQFGIYLQWIGDNDLLSSDEINRLRNIRNKFSHSEFPTYWDAIPKITEEAVARFEDNYRISGRIEQLDISLSKLIAEDYRSIANKILQRGNAS